MGFSYRVFELKRNKEGHRTGRTALKRSVLSLYQRGYAEAEILQYREELAKVHELGGLLPTPKQSTLNRWLKEAREADSDVEIWHLLNRRQWKPGMYTNWKPDGILLLGPFYDPLRDRLYLGPGMDYLGDFPEAKIVRTGKEWEAPKGPKLSVGDAAGMYLAALKSLGYSIREMIALWKGSEVQPRARHQARSDDSEVQWLISELRRARGKPLSVAVISRTLKVYSFDAPTLLKVRGWEYKDMKAKGRKNR